MIYRSFPRTEWQCAEIGYGTWGMAGWSGVGRWESIAALDCAVALGCNFFDTAWAYGTGTANGCSRGCSRPIPASACTSPRRSPRRTAVACQGGLPSRRCLSAGSHPRIHGEEPPQSRGRLHRPAATARLVRCMGGRRAVAAGGIGPEGARIDSRLRDQRQSLAARERVEGARHGLVDAVQVVYNLFDQAPEDELFPHVSRMRVGCSRVCRSTKAA